MAKSYSKKYEINYYDVDYSLRCKLSSLVNFFCDVGNAQSESLGDDIDKLMKDGMAWVFYKYDIKINEYPKYRDVIEVETVPLSFNRFYAHRGYKIKNKEGIVIGEGTALFFLIDLNRRRPMRIPAEKIALYESEDVANKDIEMEKIVQLENIDSKSNFKIRYSDIDSNGHVNNSKYFEWAIESVPAEIVKEYKLDRVKIVFDKETTYGHEISVLTEVKRIEEGKLSSIHIIKSDDEKELTKVEIEWIRE